MALAAIDTEAEEESGINRELAAVMCTRMDAARRATEKLLGVLQVGLKTSLPEYPHRWCLYVQSLPLTCASEAVCASGH